MANTVSRFSNLNDWLCWLETIHPCDIDLGLERIRIVADRMGIGVKPANKAPIITIAGTNGKGSCVSTLQQLFCACDLNVGSYTSPHILNYNERIQINGLDVSDELICEAFTQIDNARQSDDLISLTYFEFSTLAALKIFEDRGLDVWLLEVGLGGRLDAVNIMDADIAVITSIALDHEHWLGDTRELIAVEKAGIIRRGASVICADYDPPDSLQDIIEDKASEKYFIAKDFDLTLNPVGDACAQLTIAGKKIHLEKRPALPLPSVAAGAQVWLLVALSFTHLNLLKHEKSFSKFFSTHLGSLCLDGRFEYYQTDGASIIFDVGHNPAAGRYLADRLISEKVCDEANEEPGCKPQKLSCFTAMMSDKNIKDTLNPLLGLVDTWFCSELESFERSAKNDEIALIIKQSLHEYAAVNKNKTYDFVLNDTRIVSSGNFDELLQKSVIYAKEKQQTLLVFGSFYTVAQAKMILLRGLEQ